VVSILKSIKQNGWASFEDIIMKSQSRSDIVATFLATLQLMAKRIIFIKETDENNIPILEINYDRERRNSERADDFQ
jgi:chromatin segregation and condensation protein Rec8/ScpA/Scc1 (kleisin family)